MNKIHILLAFVLCLFPVSAHSADTSSYSVDYAFEFVNGKAPVTGNKHCTDSEWCEIAISETLTFRFARNGWLSIRSRPGEDCCLFRNHLSRVTLSSPTNAIAESVYQGYERRGLAIDIGPRLGILQISINMTSP